MVTFLMLPECLCRASRKKKPSKGKSLSKWKHSSVDSKQKELPCIMYMLQHKDAFPLSLKCHELIQARITWEAIRTCLLEISKTTLSKALYCNISNIFTSKKKPKLLKIDFCSQKSKMHSSEARSQEGGSQPPRKAHLSC